MHRMLLGALAAAAAAVGASADAQAPFFRQVGTLTWEMGNDVWNVTQGRTWATKLWYRGCDCVGGASGHYASYSTALVFP